jgi:hypothetical protein
MTGISTHFNLGPHFDPHRVSPFKHKLCEHPLLKLESLYDLARRLPTANVRFMDGKIEANTHFVHDDKRKYDLEEKILGVAQSKTWVAFHYIEADPLYRDFVDSLLEEVRPFVEPKDPGMRLRQGWIFVSPPNSVTPFHMDLEQNFLIHIKGRKKLSVWDSFDRVVVPETALETFHSVRSLKDFRYKPEFQARAHEFDLEPGQGVFMPSTSPHWVQNTDEPSITMSLTFWSDKSTKRSYVHRTNALLRKAGLNPAPAGVSAFGDALKNGLLAGLITTKRALNASLGR